MALSVAPTTAQGVKKLSIIIPVYNERSTIEEVIRRVLAIPLAMEREVIVADDGSWDGTGAILKELEELQVIKVHTLAKNQGKGAAVRVGLAHATGDVVLIQDADLELAPEEYPRLLEPILSGESDVVYGSRFLQRLPNLRFTRVLLNKMYVALANLVCGSRLTDVGTAYKVFRSDVVRRLPLEAVGFDIDVEVTVKLLAGGWRIVEVPISYRPRNAQEGKKIRWWHGIGILCRLLSSRAKTARWTRDPRGRGAAIAAAFVAVTLLKLSLAAVWGYTTDISNTLEQARAYLAGGDLLDPGTTGGNPSFFPMGHYLLAAGCLRFSQWTGLPFAFLIKVPAILADLFVALLLWLSPRGGLRLGWLYLLNPVTFLLAVCHGQLHTVATAGAVLSLWCVDRGWRGWASGALGLAASVRQHFAALVIPFLRRSTARRAMLLIIFAGTVLVVNLPLVLSAHPHRMLAPQLYSGAWGYSMLLLQGPRLLTRFGIEGLARVPEVVSGQLQLYGSLPPLVWLVAFGIWAWRRGEGQDLWASALLFLVGVYVVSVGIGVQWLVWAVPFWLMVHARQAIGYSLLAGAFLAGSYWQWGLNEKYGVGSITANLALLSPADLAGVVLVGLCGLATWAYCARAGWRLWRTGAG